MSDGVVLLAENLRKTYSSAGSTVVAVNDVSLRVATGEVFALLGPNGAGKTTTIKMVSGLLLPNTGAVRINGLDPYADRQALRQIGSVLEGNRNLYWRMTARENLIYFGVLKGMTIAAARSRSLELLDRFELKVKQQVQVQKLSRGMQQRLAIAISMMHRPALLLLDEPALGLDAKSTQDIKLMVRELTDESVGVLLTTHQMNIAEELSDRIAIMKSGQIIQEGPTADLLREHVNDSYQIDLVDALDSDRIGKLEGRAEAQDGAHSVFVSGPPELLYEVLAILEPLAIRAVKRRDSDLGSIFLKLTEAPKVAAHA